MQCQGTILRNGYWTGERCSRAAIEGSTFCRQHDPATHAERRQQLSIRQSRQRFAHPTFFVADGNGHKHGPQFYFRDEAERYLAELQARAQQA